MERFYIYDIDVCDIASTDSAELVPVRDVSSPSAATTATDVDTTAASSEPPFSKTPSTTDFIKSSESSFNKTAQHHSSMTFVVDFGDGGGSGDGSAGGASGRNPGSAPLSDYLPARLRRRKSVQSRIDREDQDDEHDASEVGLLPAFTHLFCLNESALHRRNTVGAYGLFLSLSHKDPVCCLQTLRVDCKIVIIFRTFSLKSVNEIIKMTRALSGDQVQILVFKGRPIRLCNL